MGPVASDIAWKAEWCIRAEFFKMLRFEGKNLSEGIGYWKLYPERILTFFSLLFFSLMLTLALILKFSAACLPLPHLCDSRDCVRCGIKCPRILSFKLWLFTEITISNFFPPCKRGTTRTSYNLARSNDFPSFLWLNSRSARGWQNFWNVNAFNSSSGVLNCQNLAIFSLSWYGMLHANSTSLCLKFKIFVG